ncbi:glycoside hydrolase family 19 protein [Tenacibaculum sp. TC6]|uniref:glycoside hydrolase family 19 protein n=1 Tax=Tenacibaculum sp. TC6 TaxID=3423223 RepID=UPI003D363458
MNTLNATSGTYFKTGVNKERKEKNLPIEDDIIAHPLVTEELWNTLFPYRFGAKDTGGGVWVLDPKDDFYTYASFIEAINRMGKIKVIFERRCGTNAYKVTRIEKETGVSKVIRTDADFEAPRNADKEIITEEVDYASFLEEGDLETRKRELIAFFANISHETTGGWATAPGGRFSWGLHFREEPTDASYAYPDTNYPPTPGKSYKGRGPIQLSYNYNYGPASEFIFGDKQVLLDNPERVIQDAALAFQTAIWFWMTPQYPKPSAHNVMTNKWVPNDLDVTKNRVPGLGMTVNIINGGVECGQGTEKPQVVDRIGYYERYAAVYGIGTDMDGVHDLSDCGCKDMSKYGGDAADLTAEPCAQKPAITFVSPIESEVIKQESFSAITVNLAIDQKNSVVSSVTTTIGNQTFSGTSFTWTPNAYGTQHLVANAVFENGLTATATIKVIIWDGVTLDCTDIPEWRSTKIYDKPNNYVNYSATIYRNKWYAGIGTTPGVDDVWEKIKDCGVTSGNAPVIQWQSPSQGQVIEQASLSPIVLKATATDNDGTVQSFSFNYNNTTIAASSSGNEYTATFTPASFGQVTVIAIAMDNENQSTRKEITFTVKETGQNAPPVISQVTPGNNTSIEQTSLTAIELKAVITDDTSVQNVEFMVNSNTVQGISTTNSEYTTMWTPGTFGTYTLKISATDNEGATTVSTTSFTIQEKTSGGNCGSVPAWEAKVYAQAGAEVSYNGTIYKNKWYASSTEIPGSSDVWDYVQSCNGGGSTDFCGSPEWLSSKVYNTGDTVYYHQNIYRAKWWTQNNLPGETNEWEYVSECVNTTQTVTAKVYPTVVADDVYVTINSTANSHVKIELFDASGKLIQTIINTNVDKGTEVFAKKLVKLKSGLYFYKIHTNGSVQTKKIIKN